MTGNIQALSVTKPESQISLFSHSNRTNQSRTPKPPMTDTTMTWRYSPQG